MTQPPWPPQGHPWQPPVEQPIPGTVTYQQFPQQGNAMGYPPPPGFHPPNTAGRRQSSTMAIIAGVLAISSSALPLLSAIGAVGDGYFTVVTMVALAAGVLLLGGGIALILRTRVGQVVVCLGALCALTGLVTALSDGLPWGVLLYPVLVAVSAFLAAVLAVVPPTMKAVSQTNMDSAAAAPRTIAGQPGFGQRHPQYPPQPYQSQPSASPPFAARQSMQRSPMPQQPDPPQHPPHGFPPQSR